MTHAARRLGEPAPRARSRPSVEAWVGTPRARTVVGLLAGGQLAWTVGGLPGVVAGVLAAVLLPRWLSRLEPIRVRRRRARLRADLPVAVDLIAVCLRAGHPPVAAVATVADAVGGPLGADLGRCAAWLRLGADPATVWGNLSADPVLGPVGRALVRAADIGAPVADALDHLSDDLRRDRLVETEELARRVAVRSAGPLGLCFLPAFVLVGVAPTVVGAFASLRG